MNPNTLRPHKSTGKSEQKEWVMERNLHTFSQSRNQKGCEGKQWVCRRFHATWLHPLECCCFSHYSPPLSKRVTPWKGSASVFIETVISVRMFQLSFLTWDFCINYQCCNINKPIKVVALNSVNRELHSSQIPSFTELPGQPCRPQ